ncbi:Protein crossbronx-like protein [Zalerion maritima]|uniref:Protein crossbronx-like protein n=1 Tax=Zalerion maritima TaxID=339359 RepID=A0AAD5RU77_9PEZI|nr:Protein crossbronx-like protein [Zalerion maritima]
MESIAGRTPPPPSSPPTFQAHEGEGGGMCITPQDPEGKGNMEGDDNRQVTLFDHMKTVICKNGCVKDGVPCDTEPAAFACGIVSKTQPTARQHLVSATGWICYPERTPLTGAGAALASSKLVLKASLKGPYSPAVLRFQISFPDNYPTLPPLVTFSTDMFHPLVAPLITYMYSTDVGDSGTVSASDEERLPPGGFSLRHGFPDWFGRSSRSGSAASRRASQVSGLQTPPCRTSAASISDTPDSKYSRDGSVQTATPSMQGMPGFIQTRGKSRDAISTYDVLQYIRFTFDSEKMLDSIPLEAAGNPGAWHAWRTHRIQEGKHFEGRSGERPPSHEALPTIAPVPIAAKAGSAGAAARRPGEWNWEGVWEERVRKGIAGSLSEPVLFGNAGVPNELINFLKMDQNEVDTIKDNLSRTLGNAV